MTNDAYRPAGWYPDPDIDGTERWWNGTSFGDQVRLAPDPVSQPDPWPSIDPPGYPHAETGADRPGSRPPGWYPDPAGAPQPRWWDGSAWTHYAAPPPPHYQGYPAPAYAAAPYGATTIVTMAPPKSVGVAFLLTFFFGPLGMLYSTVSGALIMIAVGLLGGFIVGVMTFGLAWFFWGPAVWLTSIIWGCVAADNQARTRIVTHGSY